MTVEILAVGTELLLGDILNTNARYLSNELARMGFSVLHQSVVGDNPERLNDAVKQAISRSDILITTGGLGPTGDDITRETVAAALGVPLELDGESLKNIQDYFKKTGREMTENNTKQAMLPHGCIVFKNDWGTAPGCAVENYGKTVIMLPGPPREMKPIFENCAVPYLKKYQTGTIESVNLRIFGVPESKVEETLKDLMKGENPTLAPYAKDGEVLLRITAKAENSEKALEMCNPVADEIKVRFGDSVYGENVENLQEVVVAKLRKKKLKVGLAESCTGGYVAKRITDIPGSSEIFDCGVVSYANKIKHGILGVGEETLKWYGAVSQQTAAEMARGAKDVSGADIGVGITGIAGPGGGTDEKPVGLVYIAVCNAEKCFVKRFVLGHGKGSDERELIRYLASSNALDMIRRLVDDIPQTDESGADLTVVNVADIPKCFKNKKSRLRRFIENTIPLKGDSIWEIIRKIIFLLSIIVMIVALCVIIPYYVESYLSKNEYNDVGKLYSSTASISSSSSAPSSSSQDPDQLLPDCNQLLAKNKETVGFISIPGCNINLPVVQASNNSKYLTTDFYGKPNNHGAPFLDYRDSIKPSDMSKNLIIYGHNMADGQMFSGLDNYSKNGVYTKDTGYLDFYNKNPLISFNTLYERSNWKIFAVFATTGDATVKNALYYQNTNFSSDSKFNKFIDDVSKRSLIITKVDVKPSDTLLTLSTCNYKFPANPSDPHDHARFVVIARKVRPGESLSVDPATANPNVLYPSYWMQ